MMGMRGTMAKTLIGVARHTPTMRLLTVCANPSVLVVLVPSS